MVVGGGPIAEGKVRNLMKHPCEVVLISPQVTDLLEQWDGEEGRIEWQRRAYREGDLKGAFLAIGATGVLEVDRHMAEEAERERVLLNMLWTTCPCACSSRHLSSSGGRLHLPYPHRGRALLWPASSGSPWKRASCWTLPKIACLLSKARAEVKRRGWKIPPDRWQEVIDRKLVEAVREGREEEALEGILQKLAAFEES